MCRKSRQRKAADVNKKGIVLETRADVDSDPRSATQELGDLVSGLQILEDERGARPPSQRCPESK